MKKLAFPINYFAFTLMPKKMFKGRHNLKWLEMVIIFIFLNALLLIPIPFFYGNQKTVNIEPFMPSINNLLNKKALNEISVKNYSSSEHRFKWTDTRILYQNEHEIIGINLKKSQYKTKKAAIVLNEKNFVLKEGKNSFQTMYQSDLNPQKSMKTFLLNSWYLENKGYVEISMLVLLSLIVVVINLFITLGTAFILYLSHKSSISDIKTFKESVNLVQNAFGLGCFLGMVVGLIHFNILTIILLPSVILVFMILFIYTRTHFLDSTN
ncbi:hypothetical protein EFN70_01160 [Pediococcus ethanolidurans]|uniref:hypothetical protein n=1 Tax=Pediococcus ethanolidurans TaxID=319653 RepID=UPI0021AAD810|nr:hypothetical protein [Pediococcus ethanolidurans]MCT4397296.1 hypothetical protein [Pediococcus ethanolidurans]